MPFNTKMNYQIQGYSGIWNSWGCEPSYGEGVTLSLEQSKYGYPLADIVGLEYSKKQIGKFSNFKKVRELVVLLPMVKTYFPDDFFVEATWPDAKGDPCAPCPEGDPCADKTQGNFEWNTYGNTYVYYSYTEGAYLFKIPVDLINKILGSDDYTRLSIKEIKSILDNKKILNDGNYIVTLMKKMTQFNFPPHLNWLLHTNIPPTIMYVAEFGSNLMKNDLVNIWQGSMPEIATAAEEQEVTIEHFLHEEEMFGQFNLPEITKYDIKLKIFKVKERGLNNYKNDIKRNILGRTGRSPGNPNIDKEKQFMDKWYHYNWPYDNFSLVELLNVEAGEVHDATVKEGSLIGVLTEDPFNSKLSVYYSQYTNRFGQVATWNGTDVVPNKPWNSTNDINKRDY